MKGDEVNTERPIRRSSRLDLGRNKKTMYPTSAFPAKPPTPIPDLAPSYISFSFN